DYEASNFRDADVYLTPGIPLAAPKNRFHTLLLNKTPLRLTAALTAGTNGTGERLDDYDRARERALYIFDNLGKIARGSSPKFVFAHVVAPHPPFIFGENGEDTSPRQYPYACSDGSFYQRHYGQTPDD